VGSSSSPSSTTDDLAAQPFGEDDHVLRLRLYVAGERAATRVGLAWDAALESREFATEKHTIEVIDIVKEPQQAESARVLATPLAEIAMLTRDGAVLELRRFVGNLSTPEQAIEAMRAAGVAVWRRRSATPAR